MARVIYQGEIVISTERSQGRTQPWNKRPAGKQGLRNAIQAAGTAPAPGGSARASHSELTSPGAGNREAGRGNREPATADPASHASCPATGAGGELEFGVKLSEKGRKEDLVFPPLPKGAPNASWTPASHPASRETGGLHVVLMLRAAKASCLGPRGTSWWGVPYRQLPGGRVCFISAGLVF